MERGQVWALVLAAGEGTRVRAMTVDEGGRHVPKQYYGFGDRRPMIRWALDRAEPHASRSRTVVVVAEEHRVHWEQELADLAPPNVVAQPRNRGTGVGLLLPLVVRILAADPEATVLVLPSDHFVADERVLGKAVERAIAVVRDTPERLALLGIAPESPDPDYGWILPDGGAAESPPWPVRSFVEKPDAEVAGRLKDAGALVNSFIFAASGFTLLGLYEQASPGLVDRFRESGSMDRLYEKLPELDFSRDILAAARTQLSVLPVPECGWNDLGTPGRIQRFRGDSENASGVPRPCRALVRLGSTSGSLLAASA
jgi:mannose-1-phosphate guanylyltransferase